MDKVTDPEVNKDAAVNVKDTDEVKVISKDNLPAQSKLWRPWEDSTSCEAAVGEGVNTKAVAGEGVNSEAAAGEGKSCEGNVNVFKEVVENKEELNCEVPVKEEISCEATADICEAATQIVLSNLSNGPMTPPVLETPRRPWAGGEESPGTGVGGGSPRRYWYWRPWTGGEVSPVGGGKSPRRREGGRSLRRLLKFQGRLVREEDAPPTGLQRRLQFGEGGMEGGREGGPVEAASPATPCQEGLLPSSASSNIMLRSPLPQGGTEGVISPWGQAFCHTCYTWGHLWPRV
jgi:hypothetical protein